MLQMVSLMCQQMAWKYFFFFFYLHNLTYQSYRSTRNRDR